MTDLSPEELVNAEDEVLNPSAKSVPVLGRNREIRPLPAFYAKKLSKILNKPIKEFIAVSQKKDNTPQESALGGQEELLADTFTEALLSISEFYDWSDFKAGSKENIIDKVEKTMTISEIKDVIDMQVKANEDSDFLLVPWRLISNILIGVRNVGKMPIPPVPSTPSEEKQDSTSRSPNALELVH